MRKIYLREVTDLSSISKDNAKQVWSIAVIVIKAIEKIAKIRRMSESIHLKHFKQEF